MALGPSLFLATPSSQPRVSLELLTNPSLQPWAADHQNDLAPPPPPIGATSVCPVTAQEATSNGLVLCPPTRSSSSNGSKDNMDGWMLLKTGKTWPFSKASVGSLMQGMFWKWVYVEIGADNLSCWLSNDRRKTTAPFRSFKLAQFDEVAVRDEELVLRFRESKAALCLRAESGNEADRWGTVARTAIAGSLRTELPVGWDIRAMLKGSAGSARLVNKETLPGGLNVVQKLLDHTFIGKTTRDRRGETMPLRLKVQEIVTVQNGAAWIKYSKARSRLRNRMGVGPPFSPDVMTNTLGDDAMRRIFGTLDAAAGEYWLFHGTTTASAQGISDKEFRVDLAGQHRGCLYGKGVYLAEACCKADEYAEADEDGLCRMLLCRATLGKVLVDTQARPDGDELAAKCKKEGCDSLLGDRWTAVGSYREYVVYDSSQVYPAYIITYRRETEAILCRAIRDSANEADLPEAHDLIPYAARLSESYPDKEVRYRLSLLMNAHADAVVPALMACLEHPRKEKRRTAARALAQLASETTAVERMENGTLHRRRREGTHAATAAVPALAKCLQDEDLTVRKAAARALERLDEHAASAVPALAECLKDTDEDMRCTAACALGHFGASAASAVPELVRCTLDPAESVRVACLTSLGHLGLHIDAEAITVLVTSLQDEKPDVRSAAAFACGQLGEQSDAAVAFLEICLTDTSDKVRKATVVALGHLGGNAVASVPALGRCLKDESPCVRKAAATTLGQLGSHALLAVPALTDGLRDTTELVRKSCAISLGRLGPEAASAVPTLARRGLVDSNDEVRAAVALTLSDMIRLDCIGPHADAVEKAMTVRLKDSNDRVRKAARLCLQYIQAARDEAENDEEQENDEGESCDTEETDEEEDEYIAKCPYQALA